MIQRAHYNTYNEKRTDNMSWREYNEEWERLDQYYQKVFEEENRRIEEASTFFSVRKQEGLKLIIKLDKASSIYKCEEIIRFVDEADRTRYFVAKIEKVMDNKDLIVVFEDEEQLDEVAFKHKRLKIYLSNSGTFETRKRQKWALKRLYNKRSVNENMKEILLTQQYEQEQLPIKSITSLEPYLERFDDNEAQKEAFIGALKAKDIYLIQGPPGTGKTTVITELVNYIVDNKQTVLIASETHVAVDNVFERMQKANRNNLLPVRLGNAQRVSSSVLMYTADECAKQIMSEVNDNLQRHSDYDVDAKTFKELLESKFEKEIEKIKCQIESIKQQTSLMVFTDKELIELSEYLKKNQLCRELYKELLEQKTKYEQLSERHNVLLNQKRKIDVECSVKQEQKSFIINKTMLKENENEIRQLEYKKNKLEQDIKALDFEAVQAAFRQLQDKYNRVYAHISGTQKMIMERKNDENVTIQSYMQEILGPIRDIIKLQKTIKFREKNKRTQLKKECDNFERRKKLLKNNKNIVDEWKTHLPYLEEEFKNLYMNVANVVGATCSGIAASENQNFHDRAFDYVIVDEAARCSTLNLLIPLTMGKKVILVGDQKQLYPMLPQLENREGSKDAKNTEKERQELKQLKNICKNTLFKQLYEDRLDDKRKIMLKVQYRMVPQIGTIVSDNFYDGQLINGRLEKKIVIPGIKNTILWIDSSNTRHKSRQGSTSLVNEGEQKLILNYFEHFDHCFVRPVTIGVICYYRRQAEELKELISNRDYRFLNIECDTVDAFQGKEKDIIFIDLVRASGYAEFMEDANRLNVAISRAREFAVIVGSSSYIQGLDSKMWNRLYQQINEQEGD